jgi:hypothetical protein
MSFIATLLEAAEQTPDVHLIFGRIVGKSELVLSERKHKQEGEVVEKAGCWYPGERQQ